MLLVSAVMLIVSAGAATDLAVDAAVALFLLDLAVPYRYLEIRGDAEVTPDEDDAFAERVDAKYHANHRQHDQPGQTRVIVTINPSRVNAIDMRG